MKRRMHKWMAFFAKKATSTTSGRSIASLFMHGYYRQIVTAMDVPILHQAGSEHIGTPRIVETRLPEWIVLI